MLLTTCTLSLDESVKNFGKSWQRLRSVVSHRSGMKVGTRIVLQVNHFINTIVVKTCEIRCSEREKCDPQYTMIQADNMLVIALNHYCNIVHIVVWSY